MDVVAVANYTTDEPVLNMALAPILLDLEDMVFTLDQANDHAQLHWELEHLGDLVGFELEYSSDGIDFKSFADFEAEGLSYDYIDPTLRSGTVAYYRIKAWHEDGSFEYSTIQAMRLEQGVAKLKVFPNPVRQDLQVQLTLPKAATYQLELYATDGRRVWSQQTDLQAGINECPISMNDFPSGWYTLHIRSGSNQLVRRIVKQ